MGLLCCGRYHDAKGFQVILVASLLKLVTLGFTVVFSGLLLLCIKWQALHYACILEDTCDLAEVHSCLPVTLKHDKSDPSCMLAPRACVLSAEYTKQWP